MDSATLGGRWRDGRGRCVVLRPDGTTVPALALGMDDHGCIVVAVKGNPTTRRETVKVGAVIMDSDRDAEVLRQARLQHTAGLQRLATTNARSALAAAIASAQSLASQDKARASVTARAMAGER